MTAAPLTGRCALCLLSGAMYVGRGTCPGADMCRALSTAAQRSETPVVRTHRWGIGASSIGGRLFRPLPGSLRLT